MASAGFGAAFRHLRGLFGAGTVAALEDGQLLARYEAERDEAAFEALIGRHGPMVLTICRGVLRNEHDVEDAFQATFLVLARKAGSIQGKDNLAGWLHRVAYRASVQAGIEASRRRRKEAEASAMARMIASHPDHDPELGAILHAEIDRLPGPQRLPIVLCDLEGLTYEQAARQLRWTVPTLRNRLARGRQRLRSRLTRRGVMVPAIGALLAPKAMAAVPSSLARITLSAATGGSASAGAALLSHTLLRGMLMTKIKIASTAALAALGLASVGLIAAGRPEDPKAMMKPAGHAQAAPGKAKEPAKPGETFEIGGVVKAPDGRPVAGARVRLAQVFPEVDSLPEASSGPDGRFSIRVPRSVVDAFEARLATRYPKLMATAPGFAPGWVAGIFRPDAAPGGWGITLSEPGSATEGRVVDLEGRPIAGARVESKEIHVPDGRDLPTWLASAKAGGIDGIWRELEGLPVEPGAVATTGPDGRFKLPGPGPGRVASLLLTGPSIATETLYVLGDDLPELLTTDKSWVEPRPLLIHAPRFQHASAPSPPIEGIVRDKDSGKPIAGVRIMANVERESDHTMIEGIEAHSDAEGHYRLTGLPKWTGYRLFTFPDRGLPYTGGSFVVKAGASPLAPIPFDIPMKRGIVVRGRVTDKATGKPIKATVEAHVLVGNPHIADYPGYRDGYRHNVATGADGHFEVVTLPGRGLLTVRADDTRYLGGVGAEPFLSNGVGVGVGQIETVSGYLVDRNYHSLTAIDLDPSAESATKDLQADPGRSLSIAAVGPDGKPIDGIEVNGMGDIYSSQIEIPGSTFEVHALDPSRPRRVIVIHEGRKLIGTAFLKGDEPGPITVRLEPWGTFVGRVVNDEGRPRAGIELFNVRGIPDRQEADRGVLPGRTRNQHVSTDGDGRFRVERLIPGLKYGAYAANGVRGLGPVFEDRIVGPGEVKDLGDLKIVPSKN